MQIVEGSQNPTQWSHPSHPGSLWSLAILCGPLWCFPGPLRSLAVFIVTQRNVVSNVRVKIRSSFLHGSAGPRRYLGLHIRG